MAAADQRGAGCARVAHAGRVKACLNVLVRVTYPFDWRDLRDPSIPPTLVAVVLAGSLLGAACCGDDDDGDADDHHHDRAERRPPGSPTSRPSRPATTYADLVFAATPPTHRSATELQAAIDAFVAAPDRRHARRGQGGVADARDVYGPTEVFRFYDGPIDDPDDGPEGQINAWPMDEAYVDYVEDDPEAGIINDAEGVPEITTDVIVAANEEGGETNISTGWHAIEFLLWGQDLSEDGPGARPVTDYTTVADRRAARPVPHRCHRPAGRRPRGRRATSGTPRAAPTARTFLADPRAGRVQHPPRHGRPVAGRARRRAHRRRLRDQGPGGRALLLLRQHDADVVNNAIGIQMAYTAEYEGVDGTSLSDVVAEVDPELDEELRDRARRQRRGGRGPRERRSRRSSAATTTRASVLALIDEPPGPGRLVAELPVPSGYEISLEI